MSTYKLLDLFCGGGGAGVGYWAAGFEVVGVDINPQPNYPFEFIQADAIDYVLENYHKFDAIHASPPCQAHSGLRNLIRGKGYLEREHLDFIPVTRIALSDSGLPYIIENVVGAPLINSVQLCGSSFGLDVKRHRLFESNILISGLSCRHEVWVPQFPSRSGKSNRSKVVGVYGTGGGRQKDITLWKSAMGIDWMDKKDLSQAIPPAYTEYLGRQLLMQMEKAA